MSSDPRTAENGATTPDVAATPLADWYGRMRMESEDDLDLEVHVQIRADGRHVGGRKWARP